MQNILITSFGSLVGYNVLDTLEGRSKNLRIIGINSIEEDSNIYRCDKAYKVPSTKDNEDAFLNRILEIIDIEKPHLIVPCRDDDLRILDTLREQRPEFADICLSGGKSSMEIMLDKWLTCKFACSHDLPFAKSAIPNTESGNKEIKNLLEKYGSLLLVKPREGFAHMEHLSQTVKLFYN